MPSDKKEKITEKSLETAERFQQLLKLLGFPSVSALAKDAGIPQQTLNTQVKNGQFSQKTLTHILVNGGSADWLLTGEGAPLKSAEDRWADKERMIEDRGTIIEALKQTLAMQTEKTTWLGEQLAEAKQALKKMEGQEKRAL